VNGFITWRTKDFTQELRWIKAAVDVGSVRPKKPKRQDGVERLGDVRVRRQHTDWRMIEAGGTLMNKILATLLIGLMLTAGGSIVVRAEPFMDAVDAYLRGDYATTLRIYRPLAEQGDASAQFSLGIMYANGQGVTQDYKEAVKWYRRSAEQDFAMAQSSLGAMYANGQGVIQDYKEALKWYRRSTEQGYAEAQYNLGVLYANGRGVTQNYREAVKWFRLAAKQEYTHAQYNLGVLYAKGQGVTQDFLRAHMWINLAASKLIGKEGQEAANLRDRIAKNLTPAQVIQAQEMARQCEAKNFKNCD
jgi:uncharacterized protein